MLRNNLKLIFRSLSRNLSYSAIKVGGLGIGFAAAILISVYVYGELTYDQHYEGHETVYRLNAKSFALTSIAHLNKIKSEVAGVEEATILFPNPSATFTVEGKQGIIDKAFYYTTPEYADLFKESFILGSENGFSNPNGLVLTEGLANRIFGASNPIGEQVKISTQISEDTYEVVGVVKDQPNNVSLKFSALAIAPKAYMDQVKENFGFTTGYGYIKTASPVVADDLIARIDETMISSDYDRYGNGVSLEEFAKDYSSGLVVTPLADIHLKSNIQFESSEPGDMNYLYIFMATAVFVLLLAAINYVNLATAQASKKAKEVGIRTVMGSYRAALIGRFIGESVFISVFAGLIGLAMAEGALRLLRISGFEVFQLNILELPFLVIGLLVVALLTGVLAGIYPAFYLTRFNPAAVLKGQHSVKEKSKLFRNSLVVFQFVVSLSLAIFSVFVYQQLQFGIQKDLGFDKSNVIVIDNTKFQVGSSTEPSEAFRNELLKLSQVESVGYSHYTLNNLPLGGLTENEVENPEYLRIQYKYSDASFPKTMGFELVEGRFFNEEIDDDRTAMLINETMAKNLGGNVLGRKFNAGFNGANVEIIGVLKDFHYESFQKAIGPTAFYYRPYPSRISIRYSGNETQALAQIKEVHGQFTAEPFDYYLFQTEFDQIFGKEKRLGQIISLFTGLSIFIAMLGLIGLVSYKLDQRIKEIGVRKVLGASVQQIINMLGREMVLLVCLALGLAIPLSWYAASQWMNDFAYHINIGVVPFLTVAIITIVAIFIIVTIRSFKTATANPVKALRSE